MPGARRLGGRAPRIIAALIAGLAAGLVAYAWVRASLCPVEALMSRAPRRTALMRQRAAEAERAGLPYRIDQRWVSYEGVSPLLRRAILIAEDDAFYTHGGLDWNEIRAAAGTNLKKRRLVRGGSTITQQLARNLFLGDSKSPQRKLTEVFVTLRLERALSKRRIFELYLNLIEWGDGIFGAEAASRRYFDVPASRLDERQAILLAAVIINPRRYSPLHPPRRIEQRVRIIAARLLKRGFLTEDQYLTAVGRPPRPPGFFDWLFGAPRESTTTVPAPTAPESTGVESTSVVDSLAG